MLAVGETYPKARLSGASGLHLDYFLCEAFSDFSCLSQIFLPYTSTGIIHPPFLDFLILDYLTVHYICLFS